MGAAEWGFLLDENVGRSVAQELTRRGYHAELVVDVLAPGFADYTEVIPYARDHGLVVVTKDYSDFSALSPDEHEGAFSSHATIIQRPKWRLASTRSSTPIRRGSRSVGDRNSSTTGFHSL